MPRFEITMPRRFTSYLEFALLVGASTLLCQGEVRAVWPTAAVLFGGHPITVNRSLGPPGEISVPLMVVRVVPGFNAFSILVGSDDVPLTFEYWPGLETSFENLVPPDYTDYGFYEHSVWIQGGTLPLQSHALGAGILTIDLADLEDGSYFVRVDSERDRGMSRMMFDELPIPLGGMLEIRIIPQTASLIAHLRGACGSLWRTRNNFVVLHFDSIVYLPRPHELEIRELLPDGALGVNLNAPGRFQLFSENAGRRVDIREQGSILRDKTWYVIQNVGGWSGVNPFAFKLALVVGDTTGDKRVIGRDLSSVLARIPCANCPDSRYDINGDGRILAADGSLTAAQIPYSGPPLPTGHSCP